MNQTSNSKKRRAIGFDLRPISDGDTVKFHDDARFARNTPTGTVVWSKFSKIAQAVIVKVNVGDRCHIVSENLIAKV